MMAASPFAQLVFAATGSSATAAAGAPQANRTSGAASAAAAASLASSPSSMSAAATPSTSSRKRASPTGGTAPTRACARRCGFPECAKTAKPGGFCISHGGGKKCSVQGCTTSVVSRGFCVAHGGGKRCQREGCTKSAQTGGFCWIHGGGKKCGVEGCVKRAQSGGACISHGGGKRCRIDDCNKVVQYDGLCVGHGGYRKCLSMNCSKKALANSYCQAHGGHSQCTVAQCDRKAVKGGLCNEHKCAVAAAAAANAAITPVQSTSATHPSAARHSIEPRRDKQQPSGYASSPSSTSASSSPRRCLHERQCSEQQSLATPQSRFPGVSPVKSLPPAWQLKPRALDVLPGYAFAKDRPSLLMESPVDRHTPLGRQQLQSYPHFPATASSRDFVASPLLPAIRTYSPLPALSDLRQQHARPSLQLGKRSSPAATSTESRSSPLHQPIKRLASLANIAKLSRGSTPLPATLTPLAATAVRSPPYERPRASSFRHSADDTSTCSSRWLTRPAHANESERFATTRDDCQSLLPSYMKPEPRSSWSVVSYSDDDDYFTGH